MTKTEIAKFNESYGIKDVNTKWFEFQDKTKEKSTEIPGKPTKMIFDIFKRFFKNKWNLLATVVFFALILLVIIGNITAPYGAHEKVLNGNQSGSSVDQISWLPANVGGGTASKITTISVTKWHEIQAGANVASYHLIGYTPNYPGHVDVQIGSTSNLKNNILLGTDSQGYDIWSRIMHGSGFSFMLAFVVATVETVIGVVLGAYIGFHAGKTLDTVVMRIVDAFSTIPSLVWLVIIVGVMPKTVFTLMLALLITGWIGPVYSTRIYIIAVKDREFINAAKLAGASKIRVIFAHAIPNIIGRLTVQFVHRIPAVIFAESSLFFILGASFMQDTVSLGTLIDDARQYITPMMNLWYILTPLLIIMTLTVSLQIVSNGLRDALDPKVVA